MRPVQVLAGAAAVVWLLAQVVCGGAAARVQQAPSSRIALDLPEGFEPSRLFAGFLAEAIGVSVVVVELPGAAYEQLASGLTPDALASKGIVKAEPVKLERAGPYLYLRGEQASGQGPVAKFLLAFRDKDVTALVTANVQQSALEQRLVTAEQVDRLLASASVASVAAPSRDVFRLDYLGPFKAAGTILGTTHAYTLDGKLEPAPMGGKRVVLIVAPSLDRRPVTDPEAQAEALLGGLPGLASPKIEVRNRIDVAGMEAVEMVGAATDKDSGAGVALYQALILPAGGGYYRLVGQMPLEDKERLLPELRKITAGFRAIE